MKVKFENVISKELIPTINREQQIAEIKSQLKGKIISIPNLNNLRQALASKEKVAIGDSGINFTLTKVSLIYDDTSIEPLLLLESAKTICVFRFPDPEEDM